MKCYEQIQELIPLKAKVGLYGGFVNGPLLYEQIDNQIAYLQNENFNELYTNWPPKQHLRQSAPIKTSHLSFINKFQGPMYSCTDPLSCLDDALFVAEAELLSGRVDYAVVLSAFSLAEPQINRIFINLGAKKLHECGVAILATKNENVINLDHKSSPPCYDYGYCSNFILN